MFTENQFTPTQWDTAKDKADFCNRFVRFVKSGYKRGIYTKGFYNRLSMMFGHIAHYNSNGFYYTFFSTPEGRVDFAKYTLRNNSFGDPSCTWGDAEKLLKEWAIENKMLENEIENFNKAVRERELRQLEYLKAKYESEVINE